jgi:hypothetical protein
MRDLLTGLLKRIKAAWAALVSRDTNPEYEPWVNPMYHKITCSRYSDKPDCNCGAGNGVEL